tara:strand:+ start:308 stop:553 length:246 start_codon:yes stop_codon:yes gene_type:complete
MKQMFNKKQMLKNIIQDEKDIQEINIVVSALKEVRDNKAKRDNERILINDIIQKMKDHIKFLEIIIKTDSNYLKRGYFAPN